jgi:hypothetical protein
MVDVGDRKVERENGHGVAQDQELAPVKNPRLVLGQIFHAEETGTVPDGLVADDGRAACDPSGVKLETDRESPARHFPFLDRLQKFIAFP